MLSSALCADSLYRKGLRRSTVPEARDPSAFRQEQGVKPTIAKANKGASLRANLKAMISKDSQLKSVVEEEDAHDVKENAMMIS